MDIFLLFDGNQKFMQHNGGYDEDGEINKAWNAINAAYNQKEIKG